MGEILLFGVVLLVALVVGLLVVGYLISYWKETIALVVIVFVLGLIGKLIF